MRGNKKKKPSKEIESETDFFGQCWVRGVWIDIVQRVSDIKVQLFVLFATNFYATETFFHQ